MVWAENVACQTTWQRAFFVTSATVAGKDSLLITDRTGHTTLSMLRR